MKEVVIYTDGACLGNPGPGGYAAIVMQDGNTESIVGSEAETTNNRMELMGPINALKKLAEPCNVQLYSDSSYVVNMFKLGWIENWAKKNFAERANADLVKELYNLSKKHNITWNWVKGHADNEYNNECDRLASAAAAVVKEEMKLPKMKAEYKRVLTVQDISCVGQCSLTVALPILSACGLETAILPSAVLSTHTAGFSGYTFRDLTDDMPKITDHWKSQKIYFDALYTGYLGSAKQVEVCLDIADNLLNENAQFIVDPAMADNGKLYPGFDYDFVASMRKLVSKADIVVPNITEACLLCDIEYRTIYDEEYIKRIVTSLKNLGAKHVVLTGVSYNDATTGVVTDNVYYEHKKLPGGCHGTGDVYASAFVGALVRGKTAAEAAKIAADYTVMCIENTMGDKDHWYGVKFEPLLGKLGKMIEG